MYIFIICYYVKLKNESGDFTMNKIKEFIKNKKIVILIVIIVLLLLAVGLFFIFQSGASTDNKTNSQTIENTETSTTSSKNIEGN